MSAVGILGALIFGLCATPIYQLMTNSSEILTTGVEAMPILAWCQIPLVIGIVYIHGLRGAGETRLPLILAIVSTAGLRTPIAHLCGIVWNGGCGRLAGNAGRRHRTVSARRLALLARSLDAPEDMKESMMSRYTVRWVLGLLVMASMVVSCNPARAQQVTDEELRSRVKNGIEMAQRFLINQQERDGSFPSNHKDQHPVGSNSLVGLALIYSGVKTDDPQSRVCSGMYESNPTRS